MYQVWVSESELEFVRWYRSLSQRTQNAIHYFILTGDPNPMIEAFSRPLILAA